MNYVVDKVKEEQKEDVSILTHPLLFLICLLLTVINSVTIDFLVFCLLDFY